MDYLPELAHDGHNWTAYGSLVLCTIIDDGLMGFLVGSETRPVHPAGLDGQGEGWTPQTDEEQDEVAAWQAVDQSWTQRNATVNYMIICGIPDTIFGLMLHLKSPHEKWDYLKKRFSRIPRPASWLVVEETMWGGNLLPKQDIAEETAQPTGDSDDEPANLPGGEDSLDIPNDCAETKSGYLMLETEVVDVQQVVDVLPMFEGGTAGRTWHDKHVKEHEATDKKGQRMEDEVVENRDSPGWRSEASKLADNSTSQGCRHPTENGPQTFVEHNECIRTNSETIADVPDPPGIHAELPDPYVKCSMLQDKLLTQMNSATSTELERHGTAEIPQVLPMEAGRWGDSGSGDATSSNAVCSHGAEKRLLADSRGQHSGRGVKRQDGLPAPPEPPPTVIPHLTQPYRVPRRRGRVKLNAEIVSDIRTRQNAYHAQAAPMRPLQLFSTSTKRFGFIAEGTWMINAQFDLVRSARNAETRGRTHLTPGTAITPPLTGIPLTPQLYRGSHGHGRFKTDAESVRNARSKRHTHRGCAIAIQSLRLLSMPAKSPRIIAGESPTVSVRYNKVSDARIVETRGVTHPGNHTHGNPTISPSRRPRKRRKPPWGVPTLINGRGCLPDALGTTAILPIVKTAAPRRQYKVRSAHTRAFPKREVATSHAKYDQTSLIYHPDSKLICSRINTHFY
ncbi:hypothetical protein EDC04DRAFT_3149937 [Pisolithus marmoratus]|nr:hypothetical protein EDC04DRAFT_3149937 [Pisolithus marmoratus]